MSAALGESIWVEGWGLVMFENQGGEGQGGGSNLAGAVVGLSKMVRETAGRLNEVRNIALATLDAQQRLAEAPEAGGRDVSFLLIGEVAELFRVHVKTVERWMKRHGLPCTHLGGVRRFEVSDVLRWASARKEGV